MILKTLDLQTLSDLYHTVAVHDFPKDELKPFTAIEYLYKNGMYKAFGFYEDTVLCGYALLFLPRTASAPLLDYFAVTDTMRGQGVGGQCLSLLKDAFKGAGCILLESETPEAAKDVEDKDVREKRIAFYMRNGVIDTTVRTKVFGVQFNILYLPCGGQMPKDMRTYIADCYRDMMGEENCKKFFSFI